MKKTYLAAAVITVLAATNGNAIASEDGLYLFGSYGVSESDRKPEADKVIRALGVTAFTSDADDRDSAYQLQAGYRFNRFLAVEGGYVNLGKYTYRAAATAPIVATREGQIEIDGATLGILLRAPLGSSVAAMAKAGVLSYSAEFSCTGTGVTCVNPNRTDNGTTTHYAWGVEWTPSGRWLVRAQYDIFTDVGESFNSDGTTGTSKADVKVGSIGVGYRF